MNKSELIEHMAKQADISKAAATRALEALIGGVKSTSAVLDRVRITTVGGTDTFDAGEINISYE